MHGLQSFKRDLGRCLKVRGNKLGPHPEERPLRRVSKDGRESERCIHPSKRRASARLLKDDGGVRFRLQLSEEAHRLLPQTWYETERAPLPVPSLRAKRSNPLGGKRDGKLDCFVDARSSQ
jgi:hypothetical protein